MCQLSFFVGNYTNQSLKSDRRNMLFYNIKILRTEKHSFSGNGRRLCLSRYNKLISEKLFLNKNLKKYFQISKVKIVR